MTNKLLLIIGILGVLTVGMGAMGAHAIKSVVSVKCFEYYQIGIFYQFIHLLAIFGVTLVPNWSQVAKRNIIRFFVLGILLFSGSLYVLTFQELIDISSLKMILIPATPIGGVCLMLGWGAMAFYARKREDINHE